ncbi:hypothetical protein D0Z08_29470 [Nocardioides immobilis]|uniref:HNH endonuclease n=1 Tax=Nocardioides immobilis TaxID=2049295 RepID=A0A417XTA2_9ACTN|nr:hypothetical protein [Nocardioides immobilis]RHW23447.1 hypothetical protein D0Z08_29470 [Nocardioides immobilis]
MEATREDFIVVAQLMPQPHPIVACAETVSTVVAEVAELQPVYMSPDDKRAAVVALTRAERQLAELKLRVLAAAGDVAEDAGARDVGAWLAHQTQADSSTARAEAHLATALD